MPAMELTKQFTPEQQKFLTDAHKRKVHPRVASQAISKRFATLITPQQVQTFFEALNVVAVAPSMAQEIKQKLGSHNESLEFYRNLMEARMRVPDISNNDLVNLARESRQNVVAAQQIASMNDSTGNTQFVLVYDGKVVKKSQDAIEAEFTVEP